MGRQEIVKCLELINKELYNLEVSMNKKQMIKYLTSKGYHVKDLKLMNSKRLRNLYANELGLEEVLLPIREDMTVEDILLEDTARLLAA